MISGARVNAWKTPSPSSKAVKFTSKVWPGIKCTLHRRAGRDNAIAVKDAMDKEFGKLDIRVSHGLVPLMDAKVFTLRTESRIPPRRRREFEHAAGVCSDAIPISVILYGPFHQAAGVGQFLSQRNIFLQHPGSFTKGHYYNPQEERKNFGPRGPGTNYVSNTPTRSAEEAEADLANLFDRMPNADNLPEAEPSATVKTLLLQHQKQALSFMLDHEDPAMEEDQIALWKMTTKPNGKKVWRSVVTDQESDKAPQAVRGGILADMMGLGKTLSVLALIASTTGQAASWAREADTERKRIPATLLICPLSVVSNWEEQVGTHLKKGSLRCYVYHGANRSSDRKTFAMQNVIITTYNIVSSELFGRGDRTRTGSPFSRFKFFRIVLDEAHMIREQSTFISRAACELAGSRHWALTGTPIQNRLDDLASLLRFLRVAPFEDTSNFTRYVLTPFKMANPDILMKLRLLVDSLTLRRTKDRINLPKRVDQVVKLTFSDEEKAIYDAYQKDGKNRLQAVSSQKDKLAGKGMAHVLRSILILRLLACSKVLLNEEDKEVLQGLSSSTAINVEEDKPAITTRTGYEMLKLCQETGSDMCASCGRQLRGKETVDETVLGFILPCYQLVCNDCVQQVSDEIESRTRDERLTCPMCSEFIKPELLKLTQEGLDDAEEQKAMLKANPRRTKLINPQDGDYQASTKTAALISALLDSRETNRANPTRDPIKSVVFSTWTSHLDLLEIELDSHDFTYVRLDGKMTRTKRAESLRAFREDLGVELILVSLGAGGLGLNLTAGSRVYMMEPQFNPAAEAQAIDRVHRLGQKQHVVCTRFIMEDSIEEAIQELQLKKATLAELSLGKGKVDRAEAARKKLESLVGDAGLVEFVEADMFLTEELVPLSFAKRKQAQLHSTYSSPIRCERASRWLSLMQVSVGQKGHQKKFGAMASGLVHFTICDVSAVGGTILASDTPNAYFLASMRS